jgi:hypothetical protein
LACVDFTEGTLAKGLNVIATSAEEKFKNNPDADKLSIMGTLMQP